MADKQTEGLRIGPITLVTLISVLLLAVLAVLCVTTSNATQAMAQRHAEATTETYALDSYGQAMLATISETTQHASSAQAAASDVNANLESIKTAALEKSGAQGLSVSAQVSGTSVSFTVSDEEGKALDAAVTITGQRTLSIDEWKLSTTQQTNEETLWSSESSNQQHDKENPMQLKELLKQMINVKASDVFINAGLPLSYQASGVHVRTDGDPLTPAKSKEYIEGIYELAGRDISIFEANINHDDDFSFAIPGVGRFRANIFRQRGSYGAVIRVIPFGLPNPVEMNIPDSVMDLADTNKGLVLVTGPAGSGKSTTLACLLDRMNHGRTGHIITMEDPIEYVHKHGTCIITQREIPTDIATYSEALRSAMRESPNVILLGEMRDADTIGTAMNAAEMAQLVLSTLHTTSASDTVERIVDAFPANQQRQVRIQLSMVLQTVVCQQLVPTVDGKTMPVFEIMIMNTAIRNLIREEKAYQIDSVIASNGKLGMQTMDQGLYAAVKAGKVSKETALAYANHQEALLRRFGSEGL